MKKGIDEFIEELKTNRNASQNTCLSYGRDLKKFMEYLNTRGISRWSRVTEKTISDYLDHLYKQGKADSTVSRTIASFKAFFGYQYENSLIMENPAANCIPPKIKKSKPKTLSVEEMDRFFAQDFGDTPKGIRDYTMLMLISHTGIRVTELVALEISDIDLKKGQLNVPARNKIKSIELEQSVVDSLKNYLNNARPSLITTDTKLLFTNYAGGDLSRQGFWKMLKSYSRNLDSDQKITPHTFTNYYRVCVKSK